MKKLTKTIGPYQPQVPGAEFGLGASFASRRQVFVRIGQQQPIKSRRVTN